MTVHATLRAAACALFVACGTVQAGPSLNEPDHVATLRHLKAAHVWVTGIDADAQAAGLSDARVRSVVEPALARLGIRPLSRDQAMATPDVPVFTVHLNVMRNTLDSAYSFTLEFRQIVQTAGEGHDRVHVPTWSIGSVGLARNADVAAQVSIYLAQGMDRFAGDLRRAQGPR